MDSSTMHAFKRLFTRNPGLKLLCLATALFVWCLSSVTRNTTVELAIPLKLVNIPTGFRPAGPLPAVIDYTLSGPPLLIDGARRSNPVVMLGMLGAARPGKTIFRNLDSNLKLPEGIKVLRISPAVLEIDLESDQPKGDQRK